ncbi:MAG TPA: polymer-forming cytoskeletal protein [Actinomycetota bacterium]|nr:polymer-forming cytoskeletal protein [Actinomycetota bacterium]
MGRRMSLVLRLVLVSGAAVTILAQPASAQDGGADLDRDDQIVFTGTLTVASDQTVDTALIFNGPATIDGTVRDDLIVFNGDTEVSGTVEGDVVVLNGAVAVRSGAEVGGDLITNGTPEVEDGATVRGSRRSVATNIDWDLTWFAGRFVWWLGYSVSVLILGLLLLAFAPRLDVAILDAIRARLGATIGWGVAMFFLIPIVAGILLFTVVGTPLGLFVLLGLALIYTVGYTAAIAGLGRLLMASSSKYVAFLVAWLILRGIALVPVLGGLTWVAGAAWGLGLLAVAIRSGREPAASIAQPPPPPVPVAG